MRILVIEDDPMIQKHVVDALKDACFAVDATGEGDEGSRLARLNDYDLVILDYMLPGKNGNEICDDIRSSGKYMPILMLTVRSELDHKVSMLDHGIDDYLSKPFELGELLARVRALLRRPRQSVLPVIRVGDLTIDAGKQLVRCGKREVYLTRKEFSLLEYLARNQGLVVSRAALMEHVWNMESDPFSNTIEAHILNLRKKLADMRQKLIHTVPGRGYKLESQY